jgi:alkyl hydroperoxide reductase subunit AhpF
MVRLEVYISQSCWNCAESERLAAEMARHFPQIGIELIDIATPRRPRNIFAVPTFVLDGCIISLGNPYRDDLRREIEQALERDNT